MRMRPRGAPPTSNGWRCGPRRATQLRRTERSRSSGQHEVGGRRAPGGGVERQFTLAVVAGRQLDVVLRALVVRVVLGRQGDEHLVLTDDGTLPRRVFD